jgi:hypothetical protein
MISFLTSMTLYDEDLEINKMIIGYNIADN